MKIFPYIQLVILALLGIPSIFVIYMNPDIAFVIIIVLAITSFAIWKIGETFANLENRHGRDCDCLICDPEYCDSCDNNALECVCDADGECSECGGYGNDCECEDTCGGCGESEADCECEESGECDTCELSLEECECESVEVCSQCELEPENCECEVCEGCQEFESDCECEDVK